MMDNSDILYKARATIHAPDTYAQNIRGQIFPNDCILCMEVQEVFSWVGYSTSVD